jgi:hypothetical protein
MYARVPLDHLKALPYVRRQLREGRSLCQRLETIGLDAGVVEAIVPTATPDTGERHFYDFDSGFHFPDGTNRGGQTPAAAVAGAIVEMAGDRTCTIVGDAFTSKPKDPVLMTLGLRLALFKQEVYLLGAPEDGTPAVERLLRRSSSIWRSVTVLAEVAPVEWRTSRVTWSEDDLLRICGGVRAIAVGAYDDGGYVLWRAAS